MKDKWGDIPMLYAFWCNAPKEIIHFLVKSYGSIYPDYEFDWGGLLETLAKGRVPLATIQRMVNTQLNSFPDILGNAIIISCSRSESKQGNDDLKSPLLCKVLPYNFHHASQ